MAGPIRKELYAGGLQRTARTQILSFRSFIASFDVALYRAAAGNPAAALTVNKYYKTRFEK